jgi:hypothetical protein
MFLGKIETRARTRELEEVPSPSLNRVSSIAGSLQDVPGEDRDQSKDKRAGGHFSIPENSTVEGRDQSLSLPTTNTRTSINRS